MALWTFAAAWEKLFRQRTVDHALKELCRVYVARSVECEYRGNQRSDLGRVSGLTEGGSTPGATVFR
ncbi:MAG: hypothetical protein HIU57_02225 [Acidobacteria bacterium]|nr:hypothetical protein [Acidobacteriota bacterium]